MTLRVSGRLFATALVAIALVASSSVSGASTSVASPHNVRHDLPSFHHIFEVVMENLDYTSAQETPGFSRLAHTWAQATNYFGVSHPSLPNYLALTAGSTFGITSDCVTCYISSPNLLSQLMLARISNGEFMEGVPGRCYLQPWGGVEYASKHNPFRYFVSVRRSKAACSHLLPLSRLSPILRMPSQDVPRFVWVTPNLCHDGHDCSPGASATWLTTFVHTVTASPAWRDDGVLFVTWDEGVEA